MGFIVLLDWGQWIIRRLGLGVDKAGYRGYCLRVVAVGQRRVVGILIFLMVGMGVRRVVTVVAMVGTLVKMKAMVVMMVVMMVMVVVNK
jgi:hypothetical protein